MSGPIDWLGTLAPFWASLLAIFIADTPFGLAMVWLILRVKVTVGKTGKLANVMPDLTPAQEAALSWFLPHELDKMVALHQAHLANAQVAREAMHDVPV